MCSFSLSPTTTYTNIKHARFKGEYKEFLLSRIFCHLRLNWNVRHSLKHLNIRRARETDFFRSLVNVLLNFFSYMHENWWKRTVSIFIFKSEKMKSKSVVAANAIIISSNDVFLIDKIVLSSKARHVNDNNVMDAIITPGWFWSSKHLSIAPFF